MITLWLALFASLATGQTPQKSCDSDLIRQTNLNDIDRYMERGDRCEGLYAEQVSYSDNLRVVSLTSGSPLPATWPNGPLPIQCKFKQDAEVHIQGFLLKPRPFYRLDVLKRGSAISWNWDTNVIAKYAKPANLGLVAWTLLSVEGHSQRVYLPLTSNITAPENPIKLTVLPPVEVSKAYLTITSLSANEKPIRQQSPVGQGHYLKDQRIEIDIPLLPHEGLYRIEVTADGDVGSISTSPFLVYSSGK